MPWALAHLSCWERDMMGIPGSEMTRRRRPPARAPDSFVLPDAARLHSYLPGSEPSPPARGGGLNSVTGAGAGTLNWLPRLPGAPTLQPAAPELV